MLREITILQSACGSPSAPGGINAVKKNGERNIRVVGVDIAADPSIQYYVDAFYQVPAASDKM